MTTPVSVVDLSQSYLVIGRDGAVREIPMEPGPPPRVDGIVIGAGLMTQDPPHGGERHPDGDEILVVVTGSMDVIVERGGGEESVTLTSGTAVAVPRGAWHRTVLREPSQVVFMTPGPRGEHRPAP